MSQTSNMEIDPPASSSVPTSQGGGTLKRSNSAPMINMLVATSHVEVSQSSSFKAADTARIRRLSSSNMGIHNIAYSPKPPDRVNQIKHEENSITHREAAHEKEVHFALQVTNSWDIFSLTNTDQTMSEAHRRPRSFSESLHILTTPSQSCGSPSPTRNLKCFSPAMRAPVKNTTFTPSPSPSPTRKSFIRSLSPIATQSAPLKRKLESDGVDRYDYLSPPKKFHTGPSTPDRNLPHPLAHSISSSSLEESSPEQTVPRGLMPPLPPAPHTHTHSHSDDRHKTHHLRAFMPVHDPTDIHMTDSESSDFAESSDISDLTKHGLGTHNPQTSGFTPIHPDHI
ncbi:protein FAM122A-like isoform X2 [Pomacea canaliculata]|uniref:protein FAM122A-like isoform X2 n=1 Tax=Pomacea canaliculata TaxID=400727 RepID=UPI000D737EBC|nr:protein FAM122A-like isoform X2 [Pomacea canaliculata]